MNRVLTWILGFTKLGKVTEPVRKFISGKKSYLAGAGLAIPALMTILTRFSDQGTGYLVIITSTPEWALLLNGLAVMGLRSAITKATDPAKDPNAK